MDMLTALPLDDLFGLAVALAAGLIVGLERGWKERGAAEGSRVAGLRTFGLIGLAGGIVGLLAREHGAAVLAAGMIATGALIGIGYWIEHQRDDRDVSMTTAVAGLVTFGLGAVAAGGRPESAAAAAVVVALLLGLKPQLHAGLRAMDRRDLSAALQLLLVSLVVLPLLPDRGFGPYEALNPYRLWWLVVLVSAASFAGYVAIRLIGAARGIVALGFLGGLVSSTAVSLALARSVRTAPAIRTTAAAGVLAATTVMTARIGILASVLAPALLPALVPAVMAATLVGLAASFILLRRGGAAEVPTAGAFANPFELKVAIQYAALVGAVILLGRAMREWLGDEGLLLVSAVGGLIDVDAPVIAAAGFAGGEVAATVSLTAIALAVAANSITKIGLLAAYGDVRLAAQVGAGYAAMAGTAAVAALAIF
ncbi:MgtC/SapB family protein [Desertibaculum subflavum]|uniref:MgtC/SapB family protein n=1 Tax=Desertibaculum subflavum TaxID=2268458 RepID=UPI0034D20C28